MTALKDWNVLPDNLPVPQDDGAGRHLQGYKLPSVPLAATDGNAIDLSKLKGRFVVYVYPRTGRPGEPNLEGWDAIPGARGCTPQSCGFRDVAAELAALGAQVAGLSEQTLDDQLDFSDRNAMPFPLIAYPELRLRDALGLPTFVTSGLELYKRLAFVAE